MVIDASEQLAAPLQRLRRLFSSRQVTARTLRAASVDVSHQAAVLLPVLLREGEISIAALAGAASMDLAAVSRQLRTLEEHGAVRRAPSGQDGRVTLVRLTSVGRRMAQRIGEVGSAHLQLALRSWSAADKRALARLLDRLVEDLVRTPLPPEAPREGRAA